jgi:hypothetical protein
MCPPFVSEEDQVSLQLYLNKYIISQLILAVYMQCTISPLLTKVNYYSVVLINWFSEMCKRFHCQTWRNWCWETGQGNDWLEEWCVLIGQ